MTKYRLLLEYDGSAFHGWQRQDGPPTVQQTLEEALKVILKCHIPLTAAGRTDRGVHATGQVAHFISTQSLDRRRVQHSLNGLTPPTIAVRELSITPDSFHSRFDAIARSYHYCVSCKPIALSRHTRLLIPEKVDFNLMNIAAEILYGQHHFGSFCIHRSETLNRVCTVHRARWKQESRPYFWRFEITANRFLHGMVRAIVGTLLDIGRGKTSVTDLPEILAARDRRKAGPSAPPHGLVLERVLYEE